MSESLKMSKQAEGVVDVGFTTLPQWNEHTNDAAKVQTRSGRLVAESEHEEVSLVAEAAAALHSNGNAFAGNTESGHARMEDMLWKPQPPQQCTIWVPT